MMWQLPRSYGPILKSGANLVSDRNNTSSVCLCCDLLVLTGNAGEEVNKFSKVYYVIDNMGT